MLFSINAANIRLSKLTGINRYLSGILILNLLVYSTQLNYSHDFAVKVMITVCWVSVILYAIFNEIIRQIINKSMIATPDDCIMLTGVAAIFSAVLISIFTLCTSKTEFMILYLIPVYTALLFSRLKFATRLFVAGILFLLVVDCTGWLNNSILIANKNLNVPESFTFITIMGLMFYLGIISSGYIRYNSEKVGILHNLATTDPLTGLLNRREFNKRLSEEISRAKRHKHSLSLALFDIDHFKRINDTYGHNIGDNILKELGVLLGVNTRDCDIVARYGGEEFILVLPEASESEAFELLERLRLMIEVHYFCLSSVPIQITISTGLAQLELSDITVEDFCERADKALYQAKRNGRNRIERAALAMPKLDLSRVLASSM